MSATVPRYVARQGRRLLRSRQATRCLRRLRLMADRNIGAVLVRSNEKLEGIFSERDYARKVALLGKMCRGDARQRDHDASSRFTVEPNWTADQCMALMTEKRIRHLPVMEQGRLVGVISIRRRGSELWSTSNNSRSTYSSVTSRPDRELDA